MTHVLDMEASDWLSVIETFPKMDGIEFAGKSAPLPPHARRVFGDVIDVFSNSLNMPQPCNGTTVGSWYLTGTTKCRVVIHSDGLVVRGVRAKLGLGDDGRWALVCPTTKDIEWEETHPDFVEGVDTLRSLLCFIQLMTN